MKDAKWLLLILSPCPSGRRHASTARLLEKLSAGPTRPHASDTWTRNDPGSQPAGLRFPAAGTLPDRGSTMSIGLGAGTG